MNAPKLYAAILAGGKGERFWPVSTDERPKPFMDIFADGRTLIQQTFDRLRHVLAAEQVLVVVGASHAQITRAQLPSLPAANLLIEPHGRDTAAALALACALAEKRGGPDAAVALVAADHFIPDVSAFWRDFERGAALACERATSVTFGIQPDRADTGYGYLLPRAAREQFLGETILAVDRFLEKPDAQAAAGYLEQGCLWNSGIFIWQVQRLRSLFGRFLPGIAATFPSLLEALDTPRLPTALDAAYPAMEKISIDFGIMEHAPGTYCIPAQFSWDDIGNWAALKRALATDGAGNVAVGSARAARMLDVADTVIFESSPQTADTPGPHLVLMGLRDLVVVRSGDKILVASSAYAGRLKEALRGP
ncbi:MAG: mannose-1-phosphate guanylyltransferase [Candidatus Schekmanbacteria bacterium]|nr:mannose-1-phosphate guanylyltransferase [Candidatus Schekmanbacteria bacterium]